MVIKSIERMDNQYDEHATYRYISPTNDGYIYRITRPRLGLILVAELSPRESVWTQPVEEDPVITHQFRHKLEKEFEIAFGKYVAENYTFKE